MRQTFLLLVLFFVSCLAANATTYYGNAYGSCNDSNNGLSTGAPWCTPNHAVNDGDVIIWAASTAYTQLNFNYGNWGTVTGTGHYVAWNICAVAFACKISATSSSPAVFMNVSHWAMSGFVITQSVDSESYGCVQEGTTVTDIVIVNSIASGCYGGGFALGSSDYVVLIADIAYNTAQESSECASGFPINVPVNNDTLPGTHIYLAQDFAWDNVDPNPCGGTSPTDGEGFIFDTWNYNTYTGQGVIEDSIAVWNGSDGFQTWTSGSAPIYVDHNTSWANNTDNSRSTALCGGITVAATPTQTYNVEAYGNLAKTNASTGCGGNPLYAYLLWNVNGTDHLYNNWGYSAAGNNQACSGTCTGFTPGPGNAFGTDPAFVSAPSSVPAAPSCGAYATVPACMATLIAGMVPTATGTSGLGYQPVSATNNYNPLYPQWLCKYPSQLAGLVTQGCVLGSTKR